MDGIPRAQRDRIAAALKAGEAMEDIAAVEGVPLRTVWRISERERYYARRAARKSCDASRQ